MVLVVHRARFRWRHWIDSWSFARVRKKQNFAPGVFIWTTPLSDPRPGALKPTGTTGVVFKLVRVRCWNLLAKFESTNTSSSISSRALLNLDIAQAYSLGSTRKARWFIMWRVRRVALMWNKHNIGSKTSTLRHMNRKSLTRCDQLAARVDAAAACADVMNLEKVLQLRSAWRPAAAAAWKGVDWQKNKRNPSATPGRSDWSRHGHVTRLATVEWWTANVESRTVKLTLVMRVSNAWTQFTLKWRLARDLKTPSQAIGSLGTTIQPQSGLRKCQRIVHYCEWSKSWRNDHISSLEQKINAWRKCAKGTFLSAACLRKNSTRTSTCARAVF